MAGRAGCRATGHPRTGTPVSGQGWMHSPVACRGSCSYPFSLCMVPLELRDLKAGPTPEGGLPVSQLRANRSPGTLGLGTFHWARFSGLWQGEMVGLGGARRPRQPWE